MNTIPNNCIYDATTESFVEASAYTDLFGNLVAPPGYSFVQAEVQSTPAQAFTPLPMAFNTPNYGNVGTPMYNNTFSEQPYPYGNQYGHPRGPGRRSYPQRPKFNVKEALIEQTFAAIKHGMELQNLWVDIRQEDEGFHTIRVHIKKKEDIAIAPLVIQKIVSEIGLVELSMHYLKRANSGTDRKFGLTIYMRCRKNNADVLKVIREFTQFKIHARRVRELPATLQQPMKVPHRKASSRSSMFILKKNDSPKKHVRKPSRSQPKGKYALKAKRTRDFPDEDPDLDDESGELDEAINRSRAPSIVKPAKKKSRTISVLVPNEPKDVISLKFENGTTKKIKMRLSSKSKSISKIEAEKSLRPTSATTKVAKSLGSV
jgi:hypothetical protein